MSTTAAAIKQKRYRARQQWPVRSVYQIECDRDRVHEALARSGHLANPERKDLIELALSRVVETWVNDVLKNDKHGDRK